MPVQSSGAERAGRPDEPPHGAAAPGPSPNSSLGAQLSHGSVVVAAADGLEAAGPVRAARALEQRFGSAVSAIQVLDTSNMPLPGPLPSAFRIARELIGDAPYAEDAAALRQQFGEWTGEPNEWPVHIASGTPAYEILRYAARRGAALIVMGLRRHGFVDRMFRDETTLTVARRAHAAVLAIVPELHGAPCQRSSAWTSVRRASVPHVPRSMS